MALPKRIDLDMMQTTWASELEPMLARPANNSIILKNVELTTGTNVINHRLGKKLSGWNPTRLRSAATLHDLQDSNQTPALTLVLVASADVIADIEVF